MKQICLGLQGFASTHNGRLPQTYSHGRLQSAWCEVLPYAGETTAYNQREQSQDLYGVMKVQVPLFLDPLDPSLGFFNSNVSWWEGSQSEVSATFATSSYALNSQFFGEDSPRLVGMTDGASQTIWLTEHYGWNCGGTTFAWAIDFASRWLGAQPANFAMVFNRPLPRDYYPITAGQPPVSTASDAAISFQVAPSVSACHPRLPNASTSRGLQIALGDGSVRMLSQGTTPQLFWGMATPAGGEWINLPD